MTAKEERIASELSVAAKIQADMVPTNFEDFNRREFDIYATMTLAKEVGGDFYDFFFVDENHVALWRTYPGKACLQPVYDDFKTLIKSAAQTGLQPKRRFLRKSIISSENNEAEMFVTSWIGILEISTENEMRQCGT